MIMLSLLLAASGTDTSAALMNNAKLQVTGCAVAAADCRGPSASRYRIAGSADADPTAKDRAFRADPTPCNLVGAVLCTSHPRTLLSAPIETN